MLRSFKRKKHSNNRAGLVLDGTRAGLALVSKTDDAKPRLVARAFDVPEDPNSWSSGNLPDIGDLGIGSAPLSKVLGNNTYQLQLVETPNVPEAELRSAVRWRIKDLIDYPLEEALVDLFEVPRHANAGSKAIAYAAAAHQPDVDEQVVLPKALGLDMDVVDIPELCLRNIAAQLPGDAYGTAFLHFTSECGYLTITREGVCHLIRRIETSRKDLEGCKGDEFFLRERAAGISLEVQRSLDYYESHYDCRPITELILGPGIGIADLPDALNENLGLTVNTLDLADLFEIEGELSDSDQCDCLLAVGAALRPELNEQGEVPQRINLLEPEEKLDTGEFPARFMVKAAAAALVVMAMLAYYAEYRVDSVEDEIRLATEQEAVAVDRLTRIRPTIESVVGEKSWSEQLDDTLDLLKERQAVLSLVQGPSLGDTKGFSRHLRALARQDIEGIWLTNIALSAEGDRTRLEGRTLRAELVPLYVQDLIARPAFANQRFHQFEIDNPVDDRQNAIFFSMDSAVMLAENDGGRH